MAGRLAGKVAVITGATSGIGEATARRFVAEGARVVLAGRTVERGEGLAAELGDATVFQRADVVHEADVAACVDRAVSEFGGLDCLFNNAGAGVAGDVETVTEDDVDRGFRLLVGSVLFGIKHAARAMRASDAGGSILVNSSIAAHRSNQGGYLYSVAKAAVSHATRLAAADLGPADIRVNAISPGAVATPIFWGGSARANELTDEENARKLAKLERNLARAVSLPHAGRAEDIASAAVYLASDEGRYVTGIDLVVDGGRITQFHEAPPSSG